MIETLISSKTRIKLLVKFFLNSDTKSYLRALEAEFGESTNAIRLELNRLETAGMLNTHTEGNKKYFSANKLHPLFGEIHNLVIKHVGLDQVIENVVKRLGDVQTVYVVGNFARGLNGDIIDLVLIGNIDRNYLMHLIQKVEGLIKRKIRYLIYTPHESSDINWEQFGTKPLLIWEKS